MGFLLRPCVSRLGAPSITNHLRMSQIRRLSKFKVQSDEKSNVVAATTLPPLSKNLPAKSTLGQQLKAPLLFGVGLYIGIILFGKDEEKVREGSSFFADLRK